MAVSALRAGLARRRPHTSDGGLIALGTLTKTLLWLAVIAVIGYDFLSIVTTQVTVRNDASEAASVGHDALRDSHDPQAAYRAVLHFASTHGDTLVVSGFATGPNNAVTVELRREARTMAAAYVPRIKNYTVGDAVARATDPAN